MKATYLFLLVVFLFLHSCHVNTEDTGDISTEPEVVQMIFEDECIPTTTEEPTTEEPTTNQAAELAQTRRSMARSLRYNGRLSYNGYLWTWYSQRVLPGHGLRIPGRHVNQDGYVADADGYIVLASKWHSKGTVLSTPLGYTGKVYDYCPEGNIDVYIDW